MDLDWQKFINENGSMLLLYAKQWTTNIQEAEELVQDALLRLWKALEKGSVTNNNPTAMMYKMIRWMALDRIRNKKRRGIEEDDIINVVYDQPMFEDHYNEEDKISNRKILEKAIKQLSQEQREVLVLKVWQGLTFQEIADITETSINTIAARYRYALITLKKILREEGIEYEAF